MSHSEDSSAEELHGSVTGFCHQRSLKCCELHENGWCGIQGEHVACVLAAIALGGFGERMRAQLGAPGMPLVGLSALQVVHAQTLPLLKLVCSVSI